MFDTICAAVYKQLRLRAGLTQVQLATVLTTSRMTVMRFESGRARPDKKQEAKLKELAKCSDVEFAELICEQVSVAIGRRVGIFKDGDAYMPTTALAAAYSLLDQRATELGPEKIRSLQDQISLCQCLETALEKSNTGLVEMTGNIRDQLQRDRRLQTCR